MSDDSERVNEQARFAAREFVARFAREMGGSLPSIIEERMSFAYEMGYLRGRTSANEDAIQMFDELSRTRDQEGT